MYKRYWVSELSIIYPDEGVYGTKVFHHSMNPLCEMAVTSCRNARLLVINSMRAMSTKYCTREALYVRLTDLLF